MVTIGQFLKSFTNVLEAVYSFYYYFICLVTYYGKDKLVVTAVSQVEHGVMHLVSPENSEVTVLVDCEGLSPFRIPMQIVRSCSTILQDNYPDRLGCLFVIRLPPVLRVIAQTFIQVNFTSPTKI